MSTVNSNPQVANDAESDDIDWRSALVKRLRLVVILFVFFGGISTVLGHRSNLMLAFGVAVIIMSVLLAGVLWSTRISTRTKSLTMIAGMSAISVSAYIISAYLPGGAMTAMFVLVLTSLLIGRPAFIGLLLAFTLFAFGLTAAVSAGWWSGPALVDINPAEPMNWLRVTLIGTLLWASLGFSVLFVVDTIEQHLSRRLAALESLKKEIAERRVAERARTEAEAIAAQSQKLEAVGQLAAGVAHDYNNSLLVIQGWNEIRSDLDSSDGHREATEAIQQAVDNSAQLSRQLLTFARKDVHKPRYLGLDRLVEETTKTLQNLVGARIKIRTELERDQVVYADELQVQQMLLNLVLNARDAIDNTGHICVSVSSIAHGQVGESTAAAHDWVVLAVEDDGHGIDDKIKSRIFEPFFTTKELGAGSGLGLSTAFGVAEQNGGHIEVSSEPGRTVFSVWFPSASIDQLDQSADSQLTRDSLLELRVLVLEDDALARKMLVAILKGQGCEVVECADGDAALALLNADTPPFDVLCSDAIFPGAGLETVIGEFERHSPAAKIMVCSGYVREELAIQKVESGEYAFLAKPFSNARFVEEIRRITGVSDSSN